MKKIYLFVAIISIAIGCFIAVFDTAKADCRPATTLTNTDYTRMLETVDDFIEINYLQANVAWEVSETAHPSPKELSAQIYVGPAAVINVPQQVNTNRSKLYNLVLSRECAADGWTVSKFEQVKKP